ncbi:MAG: hypothetical protein ACFCBW_15255 [Candidatus Competibacterales bacterium]
MRSLGFGLALWVSVGLVPPTTAAECAWVRRGFSLYVDCPPPEPALIDIQRAAAQRQRGCQQLATVRFGDNAAMRGTAPPGAWSRQQRRAFVAAALADRAEVALPLIDGILAADDLSPDARAAAENRYLATALRFDDLDAFAAGLAAAADTRAAAAPLGADRLFLRALAQIKTGPGARQWPEIDAELTRAHDLDPSAFSIRAYRVIVWLMALAQRRGQLPDVAGNRRCAPAVATLSHRLLDVSEAAPCPLLVGHFAHRLGRILGDEPGASTGRGFDTATPLIPWRLLTLGLLAHVTRNDAVFAKALAQLATGPRRTPCHAEIEGALAALPRPTP